MSASQISALSKHVLLRFDSDSRCKLDESTVPKALPMPTLQELFGVWPGHVTASGR
jgi:hypothetical protein